MSKLVLCSVLCAVLGAAAASAFWSQRETAASDATTSEPRGSAAVDTRKCHDTLAALHAVEDSNAKYQQKMEAFKEGIPLAHGGVDWRPSSHACEFYLSALAFAQGVRFGFSYGTRSQATNGDPVLLGFVFTVTEYCDVEKAAELMLELQLATSKDRLQLERRCGGGK